MQELADEITASFDGGMPLLVAPLKASFVFLVDLSRALGIEHEIDMLQLAPYDGGDADGVRLLKDLDCSIEGRHVIVVEDVVDTGMTLGYLTRTLQERYPATLTALSLLDRPYRRLVDDVPLQWIGFTVPDELFAGYGLGLDERWRALPDLHVVDATALPEALAAA